MEQVNLNPPKNNTKETKALLSPCTNPNPNQPQLFTSRKHKCLDCLSITLRVTYFIIGLIATIQAIQSEGLVELNKLTCQAGIVFCLYTLASIPLYCKLDRTANSLYVRILTKLFGLNCSLTFSITVFYWTLFDHDYSFNSIVRHACLLPFMVSFMCFEYIELYWSDFWVNLVFMIYYLCFMSYYTLINPKETIYSMINFKNYWTAIYISAMFVFAILGFQIFWVMSNMCSVKPYNEELEKEKWELEYPVENPNYCNI